MSEAEIAWLAGLYEGEGCLSASRDARRAGTRRRWALSITMTDEDILHRCHDLTGVGYLSALGVRQERHKPSWRWGVTKYTDTRAVVLAMRPWLGQRRLAKIDEFLAAPPPVKLHRNTQKIACTRGHVYDSENTQHRAGTGWRICAQCNRDRALANRTRRASRELTVSP